jgi:hypothetical protein
MGANEIKVAAAHWLQSKLRIIYESSEHDEILLAQPQAIAGFLCADKL